MPPTYRRGRTYDNNTNVNWCLIICAGLFMIAFPYYLFLQEKLFLDMSGAFLEIEDLIVENPSTGEVGTIAHYDGTYKGTVADAQFGVSVNHSLVLNRHTEYCQWREYTTSSCETCYRTENNERVSYSCNCKTTYHYVKDWTSSRRISLLFDQPVNHNNPIRDPAPSAKFSSGDAVLLQGNVPLSEDLVSKTKATPKRVEWERGDGRTAATTRVEEFSFFSPKTWFGIYDTFRIEPVSLLGKTTHSRAASEDNFYYIGQGGYFFSPYQASDAERLLKLFGGYIEGTLFDWQIMDLFPQCTAGDIRVHYTVLDPDNISVVGQISSDGVLDSFKTSNNFVVGVLHEGNDGAKVMMDEDVADQKRHVYLMRAILLGWAAVAATFLLDKDRIVGGTIAIYGIVLGGLWIFVWPLEFDWQYHDMMTPIVLGLGICAGLGYVFGKYGGSSYNRKTHKE